tara:strand:+ start:1163 stop:1708 length:546 start_codon:yes stop_codon:yes gene_type:complete
MTSKSKTKKKRVFTKKNYTSDSGMMTSVWGPSMWHVLHSMSFNYPVKPSCEDKQKYKEFIFLLQYVLPCKHCRENLKTNMKSCPLTMDQMKDRESFSKYVYLLHETVNKMLGKQSGLTYCDVRERYENFRARCLDKKQKGEKGCTEPLWGKKAKCVLHIVPKTRRVKTFKMDNSCVMKRNN